MTQPNPLTAIRRMGTVVDASDPYLITVALASAASDTTQWVQMPWMPPYIPGVGDTVVILAIQGDYLCLGAPSTAANPSIRSRPFLYSGQRAEPASYSPSGSVAFTNAQWPALTFDVPQSGMFWVSVSGNIENVTTATSTAHMLWYATPAVTILNNDMGAFNPMGISTMGSRVYATKRVLCAVAAPQTTTLTPYWNISSGSADTVSFRSGIIIVELIG